MLISSWFVTNMAVKGNYCFWLVDLKKNSFLKTLDQIEQTFTGSIYGRFSIRFPHVILIKPKNIYGMGKSSFWLAEILKIFFSEARRQSKLLVCSNDVWEILYKISIFLADRTSYMATIGSSCLWLVNKKKNPSSLKPLIEIWQDPPMEGSI